MQVLIAKVKIDEKNRLRSTKGINVDDLAKSMKELGQIVPIVINEYYKLVAGYRRLQAAKQLKWKHIEAVQMKNLTKLAEFDVELHENWKRKNFTEFELGEALLKRKEIYETAHPEVSAKGKHVRQARTPEGKFAEKTVETKPVTTVDNKIPEIKPVERFSKSTAEILGVSESRLREKIAVAKAIQEKRVPKQVVKDYEEGKTSFTKVLQIIREKGKKAKTKQKSYAEIREQQKKTGLENAKKAMAEEEIDAVVEAINGVRKEEEIEPIQLCIKCKKALPMTCPDCQHQYILCDRDWNDHQLDEEACKKYEW